MLRVKSDKSEPILHWGCDSWCWSKGAQYLGNGMGPSKFQMHHACRRATGKGLEYYPPPPSPEPTILLSYGRVRELWPDPIFWVCAENSFRIFNQSDLPDLREVRESRTSGVGPGQNSGQTSRSLPQAKRIVGSGEEDGLSVVGVRLRTAFNTDLVGQIPWEEFTGSYSSSFGHALRK